MLDSGMLPEAIIPPSEEHSYAQWLEEHDHAAAKENQENLHLKAHAKGKKKTKWCVAVNCFELGWFVSTCTELHGYKLASGPVLSTTLLTLCDFVQSSNVKVKVR